MLLEAKRFGRRFIGISRGKGQAAYLYLTGAIYLLLVIMAYSYHDAFSSTGVLYFQTGLMCIIVPSVAQNAVAGEKEKRTWDLLVAAPVSRAQIVIGKFISVVLVLFALMLAMLPLVILSFTAETETTAGVAQGELISICFGIAISAMGTFISAVTTRSLTCQSLTYISIFLWLVMYPVLVSAGTNFGIGASAGQSRAYYFMHPFYAIWAVTTGGVEFRGFPDDPTFTTYYSWLVQGGFYVLIAALFTFLAVRAVKHANSEPGGS
jgi:ABC-type transport system involved in multi-copper enzyme maturation permease subunit